jgi:hypothetical protein
LTDLIDSTYGIWVKISWYEEQYCLSQQQRYGRISDAGYRQRSIFNEPEKEAEPKTEEPTIEVVNHQSKKLGKNREGLKYIPTEPIHYRLSEEVLSRQTCSNDLHEMSTDGLSFLRLPVFTFTQDIKA